MTTPSTVPRPVLTLIVVTLQNGGSCKLFIDVSVFLSHFLLASPTV